MNRAYLLFFLAVLLIPAGLRAQEAPRWSVEPFLVGGAAATELFSKGEGFVGLGIMAHREWTNWRASGLYRGFWVLRSCEDSQPPQCGNKVPKGRVLGFRMGRTHRIGDVVLLTAGLEAGISWNDRNSETCCRTDGLLGTYVETGFLLGHTQLTLGGEIQWMSAVTLHGVRVGWAFGI